MALSARRRVSRARTNPTAPVSTATSPGTIRETAKLAIQHGYQMCVHAIGDPREPRDARYLRGGVQSQPGQEDLRAARGARAAISHPADIPRFGQLGVVASMQGVMHVRCAIVPSRLGAKRSEEGAYVWQSLMKSGAVVSNGTDAPVEDVDPIASFYATVSRKTSDGRVFFSAQRMNRADALKSCTLNGAYAAFEEAQRVR